MKRNTRKHPTAVLTLDDMRKQAQSDARALIVACGGQNKAALDIGMSKGRFSFLVHGQWTQVAVNEVDLAMLSTGRTLREKDLALTTEARQVATDIQQHLAVLHDDMMKFQKLMRKL
jgi:hypothetical protein